MPRYVILTHDHPHLHWDFMLEGEASLRTWRLEQAPIAGVTIRAEALGEHRLAYLDYEGPVSGGRGHVTRWDFGCFEWLQDRPGEILVRLLGARLQGEIHLKQRPNGWEFVFEG